MTNQEAVKLVLAEVYSAETKHPHWPKDPIHASAIVCEESGELIRASIQLEYEGGVRDAVFNEAIQTAATCIRLIKNL